MKTWEAVALGFCGAAATIFFSRKIRSIGKPKMLFGIDVSAANGTFDYSKVVAAGKSFVISKCSEGHGFLDPTFEQNVNASTAAGLVTGAYHFFRPEQDMNQQADFFVSHAFGKVNLPLFLDFETLGGYAPYQAIEIAGNMLQALKSRTGKNPGLYIGSRFWNNYPSFFEDSPLWVAQYNTVVDGAIQEPIVPPPWSKWTFHQYAADPFPGILPGRIEGINNINFDLNRFDGSMEDLCALCDKKPSFCNADIKIVGAVAALGTAGVIAFGKD
jgi:lysozyme